MQAARYVTGDTDLRGHTLGVKTTLFAIANPEHPTDVLPFWPDGTPRKTWSFAQAMLGNTDAVTIDVWMRRVFEQKKNDEALDVTQVSQRETRVMSAAVRRIAEIVNWYPRRSSSNALDRPARRGRLGREISRERSPKMRTYVVCAGRTKVGYHKCKKPLPSLRLHGCEIATLRSHRCRGGQQCSMT